MQALESHSFEPVKVLQWRNTDLDFASIGALQASLAMTPTEPGLTRAPIAEDILVLEHAARDEDVRAMATNRAAVERLWDVCQVPDYRKIAPATHAELVVTLYGFLMREGKIPDRLVRPPGRAGRPDRRRHRYALEPDRACQDLDFCCQPPRLACRSGALAGRRARVEDKLSDALHERLTERFVDRRTSVLMRRLRENTTLETEIRKTGEVMVEGHVIGRLDGFMFAPTLRPPAPRPRRCRRAARKRRWPARSTRAPPSCRRRRTSSSCWRPTAPCAGPARPVGKLIAGDDVLRPRVRIIADEHLTGASREAVQTRLDLWLKTHIERLLAPLFALAAAEDITGMARGVAFQFIEALGVLERQKVAEEVKGLDQPSRATLRKYGVRFGAYHIYLPALLKPAPRALAAQLWALKHGSPDAKGLDELQRLAASGRTSIPVDKDTPKPLYRTVGYRVCGERAVRVDILERLADLIRPALSWREGVDRRRSPPARSTAAASP